MSAISGINQALWNIKGKVFKSRVYELMGGRCRDKIDAVLERVTAIREAC